MGLLSELAGTIAAVVTGGVVVISQPLKSARRNQIKGNLEILNALPEDSGQRDLLAGYTDELVADLLRLEREEVRNPKNMVAGGYLVLVGLVFSLGKYGYPWLTPIWVLTAILGIVVLVDSTRRTKRGPDGFALRSERGASDLGAAPPAPVTTGDDPQRPFEKGT